MKIASRPAGESEPLDLVAEPQLARHAVAEPAATGAAATANNGTRQDASTKKRLVSPPGAKLDRSGKSFGIVGPPDFHNPKTKRDQNREPDA